LQEWAKILDVIGENDASLGQGQLIDCWVSQTAEMEIVLDVFDIKVFIEPGEVLAG
jgi:hypothetical protein